MVLSSQSRPSFRKRSLRKWSLGGNISTKKNTKANLEEEREKRQGKSNCSQKKKKNGALLFFPGSGAKARDELVAFDWATEESLGGKGKKKGIWVEKIQIGGIVFSENHEKKR